VVKIQYSRKLQVYLVELGHHLYRYLLIVRPFGMRLSGRQAMCLVAVNMIMSVLLAAPVVHFTTLKVVVAEPDIGVYQMVLCIERWNSASARRAYSTFAFVVQFCLPLIATATLYSRIYETSYINGRLELARTVATFAQSDTLLVRNTTT